MLKPDDISAEAWPPSPKCKNENTEVVNTKPVKEGRWRRRKCLNCGEKFSTVEVLREGRDGN